MSRRGWAIGSVAAAVVVLAFVGWRMASQRGAPAPSAAAAPAAASAPLALDLAPTDLAVARRTELATLLAVSGGLRAVDTAVVRAKVAAEVRQLPVREGDAVQRGQVVAVLDDTEYQWRLRQAEDQAAAAKAQLEIAERTLANNKALVDQGFISQTALETSQSSAAGARASLAAARAAAEIARKGVNDAVLRAPLPGLVSQRFVQPGERVSVDARLLEVVDLSRIELEAALAPEDVAGVRVGQVATLDVDGFAQPVRARVVRINPSTQAGTRSVMTYLAVDAQPGLRQGLFARGSIALERRPALVVPASAVRLDQARPYVLVAAGGKVVQRTVTTGLKGDAVLDGAPEPAVEITAGLDDGQTVLRGSVGALRDGTAIRLPRAK
jgi:RND family efflux transporter MFP subunit